MQQAKTTSDELIKILTENYMEKLFYFCLKKTGNRTEAEDLTQDIALCVITSLNKGTFPVSFSAWVWQIARNRYSVWAKNKRKKNEALSSNDIGNFEIEDTQKDILEKIVNEEQVALLRRELAFIKSDYRNIIVEYYIKNKSLREIASHLSLPTNTVKSRLFRAREILKEGMTMAREFGKLSYKPENISFINNGLQGTNGEPWNYISRSLCKNIMLAAYRTPSTAEELAVELGVALPYMEEELSSLVSATLMKKNKNKYETNFFIVSAEAQEKIYAHLRSIAPMLTNAVIAAMEYDIKWKNLNSPNWHENYQSFEDMKWALLMMETDAVNTYTLNLFTKDEPSSGIGPWGHTLRPNGGEWDLLGMESNHGNEPCFVGLSGCVSNPNEKDLPEITFRQFRFKYGGLEKRTPPTLSYADGKALVEVACGNAQKADIAILKRLESYGYIQKTASGYAPTIMVICKNKAHKMPKKVQDEFETLRFKARDIAAKHYLFCRELIYKEIPEFLKDDAFQIDHACANIFSMRGAVLEEAIKQGYLTFDNNNDKQILGAFLVI
ncbi:MAG: sigma-70 family RNA polymerase sigma factor [Ruminococcaceae bacterium]|nr:sigma-70 family RNA polymerase sigma factor [Oscillospiraceae bacterium]